MKIIYFGTDVFLKVFEYLNENHRILALYTYHENEDYFTERNIVSQAGTARIPVHYGPITEEEVKSCFCREQCDLIFAAEYNRKIPIPEGLENFRGVNIHSSLLPGGRSYYPIEIGLARGLECFGITIHKLDRRLDSGDILLQAGYPRTEEDSVDLYLRAEQAALRLVKELMPRFGEYWEQAKKQDQSSPYWRLPSEKERTVCHGMTVEQAHQIYRCFNKLTRILVYDRVYRLDSFFPGHVPLGEEIIRISDRRLIYGLSDGNIRVDVEELS